MSEIYKAATASQAVTVPDHAVVQTVRAIIDDVRARGDVAVREYSKRFDDWAPERFRLDEVAIERIIETVPEQVQQDILTAQRNVREFATHQRASLSEFEVETSPGVLLGQRNIPVAAVGAYVPGGRYPLVASAHMTIVTAKVAGVPQVIACTPPIHGQVPAASVAAMAFAGADEIWILGGVQAVAAMAIGTQSMPRVDMITGPGNAYVAEAKRQFFGEVGIDLLAGPTESLIIADEQADPFTCAVDLLGQAEHGPDSPTVLITTSRDVAERTAAHIDRLLPQMPTRENAEPAWRDHGQIHIVDSLEQAYALADEFASEHVQVLTAQPREALAVLRNYGALFLGEGTCVTYGDKVIGTNHTLPTRKNARFTGGLWVGRFLKTVTYQEVRDPAASAELGELAARASRVESFEGHARCGDLRAARHYGRELAWAPWAGPTLR